jgi:DNA polymerase III sliding clamp (beta) subunit (PCNA family)
MEITYTTEYGIKKYVIEPNEDNTSVPKTPKIEYTAEFKVNPKILKETIKTLSKQGVSNIWFKSTEKSLTLFNCETFSLEIPEDKLLSNQVKEETKAQYNIEYLKNIFKAAEVPAFLRMSYKNNMPAEIVYSISDAQIKYWLAPKIDNN